MNDPGSPLKQVAVYHPWPMLTPQSISAWAKNMMIFFDQVALIAPATAADTLRGDDESTILPLMERGLFRFLDPATLVDDAAANQILSFLLDAATEPNAHLALDENQRKARYRGRTERDEQLRNPVNGTLNWHQILPSEWYQTSSERSKWGVVYIGRDARNGTLHLDQSVIDAAEIIWQELFRRGLAVERTNLHPLLLHPSIWATLEALIVHTLRPTGLTLGMELHPCTNEESILAGTMQLMRESIPPSQANIIESDLNVIGLDLAHAPLDEVLAFRGEYGKQYRDYSASLRSFMTELAPMSEPERLEAFRLRKAEIEDAAEELHRISRRSWLQPTASIALGIVGAAWTATHGDTVSAILSLLGGAVGAAVPDKNVHGAYSYFFEAQRRLAR
jgi:hypothetical protein